MLRELRERRDRAADKHDTVLSANPNREGDAFTQELKAIVAELSEVTRGADEPNADPVEVAKTYRWLGDAYFDLGRGSDPDSLRLGAMAYRRSEELLVDVEAPLERAITNFNYANSLRGLSGGEDVGLLEAAQIRYEKAARVFRDLHFPDRQATVEQQMRSIDPQLRLARKLSELKHGHEDLKDLRQRVEGADPIERERIERDFSKLKQRPGRGDPGGALDDALAAIREQFDSHRGHEGSGDSEILSGLEKQALPLKALLKGSNNGEESVVPDSDRAFIDTLTERIRLEQTNGKISPDRAEQLADVLKRFGIAMTEGGSDLESQAIAARKMREIIDEAKDLAATPTWSTPDPEPGGHAHRLTTVLASLNRFLLAEASRSMLPAQEASMGTDLLLRADRLESRVREAASDEKRVADLEGDVWRLAVAIQEHARRNHLNVARPDFATARVHASAKSLFVSGGDELRSASERIAQRDGVQLLGEGGRGDLARDRWNQLNAASVAIFDVGVPTGPDRAQVCYELGLSLALGKPSIVTTRDGQILPFDVNLKPLMLSGEPDSDSSRLSDEIYHTLATIVWGGSGGTTADTTHDAMAWLLQRYGERISHGTLGVALDLVERNQDDAIAFRRYLEQSIGILGVDAPALLVARVAPGLPAFRSDPALFPRNALCS